MAPWARLPLKTCEFSQQFDSERHGVHKDGGERSTARSGLWQTLLDHWACEHSGLLSHVLHNLWDIAFGQQSPEIFFTVYLSFLKVLRGRCSHGQTLDGTSSILLAAARREMDHVLLDAF